MLSDSDLLWQQVKVRPDDEVLLAAYADELETEGRSVRAGRVRELLDATRKYRLTVLESAQLRRTLPSSPIYKRIHQEVVELDRTVFLLQRRLLIRPLQVGDRLVSDEEGRAVPASAFEGVGVVVGTVVSVRDGQAQVLVGDWKLSVEV